MEFINIDIEIRFKIIKYPNCDEIFWKVKNNGEEAKKNNQERGEIFKGGTCQIEYSGFNGNHYIECYLIQDNVCIGRKKIDV